MSKEKLTNSINLFQRRGEEHLQKKWGNILLQIQDNLKLLNQSIAASEDAMSVSEWVTPDKEKTPSCTVAPARMRFGSLRMKNLPDAELPKIDIPLLLPMKAGAIMVNLGTDADKVPALFQNIILRLLMTMRMDLVKVSVVDMDFGSSFPVMSSITNPMFKNKGKIVFKEEDVTKLVDEMAKEIGEANKIFLGRDIDLYNASADEMAHPYHFVFIDDFPSGFSTQSIDLLIRMIENGNAYRAGIRIFINYSKTNAAPREFNLQRFAHCCSWINRDHAGTITFENCKVNFPVHTIPCIELEITNNITEYLDYINDIKPQDIVYSLDNWIDNLKETDGVWKGSTMEGIKVPIGYRTPKKTFDFYICDYKNSICKDYFTLIAGLPGYGKTVLLHNIIVNAAMKYSPDELNLYIADFADGASFSEYRTLPHVKAIMLSNNREYVLRMLKAMDIEAEKRAELYKEAADRHKRKVDNIVDYREVTGEKMPLILFVMDEFHYLFLQPDPTSMYARDILCNGIRQWRKFGISIILCTQSIGGVNFGNADTLITYRFALNLPDIDSKSVIRNDAAKSLTRKGQTIMNNTTDGREDANVEFQSAYSSHYIDYIDYLKQLYDSSHEEEHIPFICVRGTDANVSDNKKLENILTNGEAMAERNYCDVFVGKPDLLRVEHTRIRYRRQQNSNTLIIGDDYRTLTYTIAIQILQLVSQSHSASKFFINDCFNDGDSFKDALSGLGDLSPRIIVGDLQTTSQYIDDVYTQFQLRQEAQKENRALPKERIVLTIVNAQNSYQLKPRPGEYGMEPSETTTKLIDILTNGAPLGIHCIIHALSYQTLFKTSEILESNRHFDMFENIILLKGADVDNMYLTSVKVSAPEKKGQMIVINAKVDGESYEQCNAYSKFTALSHSVIADYLSNLFETYRHV